MIRGIVNDRLEATIAISIEGKLQHWQSIEVIIDTGFNRFLTLPSALITQFGLPWIGSEESLLADGNAVCFEVYRANVVRDGSTISIDVEAAETIPLLGMAFLAGNDLFVEVVEGGAVTVTART